MAKFQKPSNTLADRHQLMEAYLIAGSIFPSNVQVDEADEFHIYIYNTCIQAAVRMQGILDSTFDL